MIFSLLNILLVLVPLLIQVAFLTLLERKVLAAMQKRRGPNVEGFAGLLQPLADGAKLFFKELLVLPFANKVLFFLAPLLTLALAFISWSFIPFSAFTIISDLNLGLLFLFAFSSLGVYGIILSGWSSNSRYAFLGALRSAAQMISYEVSLALCLLSVVVFSGSFNLRETTLAQQDVWFILPLWPLFFIFFVSALAETNRHPFDLPEAEAELVAGYNVEYSAMGFAFFFIGEYANMILMSVLSSLLFFGGWSPPFNFLFFFSLPPFFWLGTKTVFFLFLFIWCRAAFPRYRYDQLMFLTWQVFLPLSLAAFFLSAGVVYFFSDI
jgi:NADH-quinone oxidoreductase subunit H